MFARRGIARKKVVKKKRDKFDHAVGPEALGKLSRQVDDDMLVKAQKIINASIKDKPDDTNYVFIRINKVDVNDKVIKLLESYYVEAGWKSAIWEHGNGGLGLKI